MFVEEIALVLDLVLVHRTTEFDVPFRLLQMIVKSLYLSRIVAVQVLVELV